jgi:hypothetical protein
VDGTNKREEKRGYLGQIAHITILADQNNKGHEGYAFVAFWTTAY